MSNMPHTSPQQGRESNGLALAVRGLVKRFADQVVLSGVTLEVRTGEVAVVLGPSGSGKTTFLRCLNGLEDFQEGHIDLAGVRLSAALPAGQRKARLQAVRRRVGMVFQQFNLFPHRTVLGNIIEAPVHVLGQPRRAAIEEAATILARVGLDDKLHQLPEVLSGGQQQRVAIARALAMKPEVILFDEPTSALDPRMAAEVESVIVDLARSGQTMVVVTHSLRLARRAGSMLHIFDQGKVVESGPPEQIFERPAHEATRRFLHDVGEV